MASTLYQFKADLKGLVELEKKLKVARAELAKLTKDTDAYRKKAGQIGTLGKQFDTLKGSMGKATTAANQMSKAGNKLVGTFKSAAVAIASAFAVRAIVGAVRGAIQVFAQFEQKMDAVAAISGATGKEFEALKDSAEKLGRTTVFTASQVAELQEEFARLGFTADEIRRVQAATLDLAAATGESLANSAQTAGAVLRAFNYDAEQTQRVTDSMAAAFTGSALNLERFKESMKFVAPVARVAGFTMEETSAALMKLADNGLHGSIAGNALKNIFLKLGDSSSKLSKKLGGTVDNMPDMVKKMRELKEEGFSLTDAVELLDKRSAPAFLALMNSIDALEPQVQILNEAEGATARMAAIRLDNLAGDMTLLRSAAEGLGIAMGEQFDASLRAAIYSFTRWVQEIANNETKLRLFQKTINLVIAALVALTARMAFVGFIKFAKGIALGVQGMYNLVKATMAADRSTKVFKATFASTPWGAVATAIATVISYMVMFGDETDEAAEAQRRLNDALNDSLSEIFSHNEASKDRAELMRQFVNDFPELLTFLDLERASNAQLKKLKDAMSDTDMKDMKTKMDNAKAQLVLDQELVDKKKAVSNELLATYEKMKVGEDGVTQHMKSTMTVKMRTANMELGAAQIRMQATKDEIDAYAQRTLEIADMLGDSSNLQLVEGRTLRKRLNLGYAEELHNFRQYKFKKKEIEMARNEERLRELELTSEYYNILATQVDQFGETTDAGKAEAEAFLGRLDQKWVTSILSAKGSVQDINIELSEFRKFVSNLDGVMQASGKTLRTDSAMSAVLLNKTKDNYKALAKIMDDVLVDQYQKMVAKAETHLEVETEKYRREIELMKTNTQRLESIEKSSDAKMLSSTIKSAKNKYDAIKNLDAAHYARVVSGKQEHLREMQNLITQMKREEINKKVTNDALLIELEKQYQREIIRLKNQENLDKANLESKFMESVIRFQETGELNMFALWNRLRDERHNREAAEITFLQEEMNRKESLIFEHHNNIHNDNLEMLMNGEITQAQFDQRRIQNDKNLQDALLKNRQDHQSKINDIQTNSEQQDAALQAQKIQQIGEYYNRAFEALSTFLNARWEAEIADINRRHEVRTMDLEDGMNEELEAAEGNHQAQEFIREKYADRQRVADDKKDAEIRKVKKKQFIMNKVNSIIQAVINGAVAITMAAAQTGIGAAVAAPIMAALVAAQIAAISSQKFHGAKGGIVPGAEDNFEDGGVVRGLLDKNDKFSKGGMVVGKSHAQGGEKFGVGGRVVELEGGEAVINKRSTAMFHGQLSAMNEAGGGVKFADGGILPGVSNKVNETGLGNMGVIVEALGRQVISGVNSKRVTVLEADISQTQENVNILELQSAIL